MGRLRTGGVKLNWESILKKEWTVDDYEHPVVKEIFGFMKNSKEQGYGKNYEPQYKALKFFETNCSKYDISLIGSEYNTWKELRVILPNDTAFKDILHLVADYTVPPYIEAYVFLKDEFCPVCIKTPPRATLPYFDYITTMVDVAANRGRGMNIDTMDLGNKWVENDITWGDGNYRASPILYTPLSENSHLFRELILRYQDDPDKLAFIADSLRPYHEGVVLKKFIKIQEQIKEGGF